MSVKKQIPSLCKPYSFNDEIPENFWDETDVDSYFYYNIFDIFSPCIEYIELAEASTKNLSQPSCSSFAI